MAFRLETVHGVDIDHLCSAVTDVLPFEVTRPRLSPLLLGGWSNVNLLMSTEERKMVVRLPGRKDAAGKNPYTALFRVYEVLGREGIAPRPLGIGRLENDEETPFVVLEFVTGTTRPSLAQMTSSEMRAISEVLARMTRTRVPELMSFPSVSDFVQWLDDRVHSFDEQLAGVDHGLLQMIHEYDSSEASIGQSLESTCTWAGSNMHGDLQESNILFTGRGAMLLDLEYLSVGESLFDLAYLFCQAEGGVTCSYPRELVPTEKERHQIDALMPLALMTVVSWSIQRIALAELGLLEESLIHVATIESVTRYTRSKMAALESLKKHVRW